LTEKEKGQLKDTEEDNVENTDKNENRGNIKDKAKAKDKNNNKAKVEVNEVSIEGNDTGADLDQTSDEKPKSTLTPRKRTTRRAKGA
jgi:DNA end-binding protein Ku